MNKTIICYLFKFFIINFYVQNLYCHVDKIML